MATGEDRPASDGQTVEKGVVERAPADLFENSEGDWLTGNANPFPRRPMPISAGRPRGAQNRRTLEMRELYLKSGFPHPLLWQGAMLQLGVDDLAARLACTALEAAELLRKIAADAAPYLESRMPTKILTKGEALPVLVVGEIGRGLRQVADVRNDGTMAIDDDLVAAIEHFQQVSDASPATSHGEASHAEAQRVDAPAQSPDQAAD